MIKYRDLSVRVKLPALIGFAGLAVFVVVCLLSLIPLRSRFFGISADFARYTAIEAGEQLAQKINAQASVVRAFSGAVELLIKTDIVPNERKREWLLAEIRYMIAQGEKLDNLWTAFEPNALDGLDSYFAGKTEMGSNSRGIFVPWIADGEIIVKENDEIEPYYTIPKETLRETITEPYWEDMDGERIHMFSIARPIIIDDEFYGVSGSDVYIDELNDMIKALNLTTEGKLITNNGTIVVYQNYDLIGQQAVELTQYIRERLEEGEQFDGMFKENGTKLYKVFVPIQLGENTATWFYVVNIPEKEIYAGVNRIIVYLLVICMLGVALIAIAGWKLIRPMLCDVDEVTNIVRQLSQGRLADLQIDSGRNRDEFGTMKTELNHLLEGLKNIKVELKDEKNRLQILSDSIVESFAARENEWIRALDNMDDGALFRSVRDLDTKLFCFDYVSATWEKITGVSAKDALIDSNNVFKHIPRKDYESFRRNIYDTDVDRKKFSDLIRYVHPVSQKTCWFQISSYMRHEGDKVISNGFIFDVTALRTTEQKLFIEQSRLQALNDMPDGTLFRTVRKHNDKILKFDYVNIKWEKITGVSSEDTLANPLNVLKNVVPEDLKIMMQRIEESYEPLLKIEVDVRYIHPLTKEQRWLNIWSYPRRDDEYTYSDGFIFDVTERKKNELELAKYRDNLEFLVHERTEELVVSTEELKSTNEELSAITEELYSTNEILDKTLSDNKYQLVVLDLLVEASGIGLWDMQVLMNDPINPNNTFLWSDDFRRLLGFNNRSEFPDKLYSWSDRIHPNDKHTVLEALKRHLLDTSGKTPYNIEYRMLRKDGNYGYFSAYGSTVRDEKGNPLRVAGALVDITEKTLIDMELEQYRTQLEQMIEKRTAELTNALEKAHESDHLKSAFLANMSHEIRTPLHGIVGLIQFFEADLSAEQRQEYIQIINNSSAHLMRLIDEIIDVSKIEAKQMAINPAPTQLNEMMHELWVNFKTYLQTMKKDHLTLILDDSRFIDSCVIDVDSFRLRQVLDNVLSNAVKFTEKGFIRFGYHQLSPRMLEFVVEDSGIGISVGQQEVIFERFRQAELGHNRQYGGFGLGLNISRSLVQLMGGEMWVKSTEGVGTSFYFTIPKDI